MVKPSTLSAAMPVGATVTARLCVSLRKWRIRVDLPVPARPVRNTLAPAWSSARARSNSSVTVIPAAGPWCTFMVVRA